MERDEIKLRPLKVVIEGGQTNPHGIIFVKIKNGQFIWTWSANKITICDINSAQVTEDMELNSNVINIFQWDEDQVYVLDKEGTLHCFVYQSTNFIDQFMEVDDLFNSSPPSGDTLTWKEKSTSRVKNCDSVIGSSTFSTGLVILVIKDGCLTLHVYSMPDLRCKFFIDLRKYNSQGASLTSVKASSLSPTLKQCFEENLKILDEDITLIGLTNGLVLWFCNNNPKKAPFVLFSAHTQVVKIHPMKELRTGKIYQLLILLNTGSVIIFSQENVKTISLPDTVETSICIDNHLVTSNLIDCYKTELKVSPQLDFDSVLLPIKGVMAMSLLSDKEVLAATSHGTVYSWDISDTPTESSSHFTVPEEHVLDNMLVQAKQLDSVYKQLTEEDSILKAVSTTMVVNKLTDIFQLTLKVISGTEFSLVVNVTKSGVVFSHMLWLAHVEVTRHEGLKDNCYSRFAEDLSCENPLQIYCNLHLAIGDIVFLELVLVLHSQQPVLTVPINKIEVDAGFLMLPHILVASTNEDSQNLRDILINLNNDKLPESKTLHECKLKLMIPGSISVNTVLPCILHDSEHRLSREEWNKITGGTKYSIQVKVNTISVFIHIDEESKALTITSCDTHLCYQVKDAILVRLKTSENKQIPEQVGLDIQALNQEFEIESFKDEMNFQALETLRNRLRSKLSCHFV